MLVLLFDDDHDEQFIFSEALQCSSPEAVLLHASSAEEFHSILESFEPDLIFLDINMPVYNGIHWLKWLRNDERFAKIPIIMYSTSNYKEDIEISFQGGANRYFRKVPGISELNNCLRRIISIDWSDQDQFRSKENFII